MSKIYILGAGPAGLGAALSAQEFKRFDEVVVIDRQKNVGGLAQSLTWEGVGKHDLGPHKLFSLDKALVAKVQSFLPSELWLKREKIARVYQRGSVMSYPPSVIDMAKYFNIKLPIVIYQFFISKIMWWKKSSNLQQAIRNKVGKSLADQIILPAITKVWGDPALLDSELAESRIQIPSLLEIIKGILKLQKESDFQAHEFDYPRGGLSTLWDKIKSECQSFGTTFHMESSLTRIEVADARVTRLSLSTGESYEVNRDDLVISTLNLDLFLNLMGKENHAAKTTMDLVLVFAHTAKKLNQVSWYFVPDIRLLTHRVSSQSAFDPDMVPNGDIVCLEYMDKWNNINDTEIIQIARQEFLQIFGSEIELLGMKSIRLKDSYPKFTSIDLASNDEKLREVSNIQNLLSIGRHGAAQYVGSLDAFDMGLKTSTWINDPNSEAQRFYRSNTNNYPILD